MQKLTKALPLIMIGALSVGAMAVMQPRTPMTDPADAPTIGPVFVPPLEKTETHVIKQGETLSGILTRASIMGPDLAEVLLLAREHINPRRLTLGAEVTVRKLADTGEPRSIEMRVNADTTVVLARGDVGWQSALQLTPVVVDTVFVAGQIDAGTTLYESLVLDESINLPAAERVQLASELGSIYAYTIDFSREIQPGDSYQIAYEREARPDGTARSRRILIGEVVNQGRVYSAIYYKRGYVEGYYGPDGKSLRLGFRRNPLDFMRVTSTFSAKRYHPILGVYRAHLGTDYGAAHGTPVYAVADGTVTGAGRDRGYGNLVTIRHHSGYSSRYAHLSRFGAKARPGSRVKQNDIIGYVGATGLATGPHLHYELRLNGRPVNSRTHKLPGGPPLPSEYRAEFKQLAASRLALLTRAVTQPRLAKQYSNGNGTVGGI
jgi:murein DD-endopeptidase MepM/ murein hydrolase activator NlpD